MNNLENVLEYFRRGHSSYIFDFHFIISCGRCFNFFSSQRNFSKESQTAGDREGVMRREGMLTVLTLLSLRAALMGARGPGRPHSRISVVTTVSDEMAT